MISTGIRIEDLTLSITEEIHVRAPLETIFAAGTATWATGTATSGVLCRPSSARRSWKSRVHCLCPIRLFRMCNTD